MFFLSLILAYFFHIRLFLILSLETFIILVIRISFITRARRSLTLLLVRVLRAVVLIMLYIKSLIKARTNNSIRLLV